MPKIRYKVTLTVDEQQELQKIAKKGSHKSQMVLNALILLNCDENSLQKEKITNKQISDVLGVSERKIDRVKKRFVEESLDIALNGHKNQRVYKKKADGDLEAHIIAVSCSNPPEGFARWSLRLLADAVVELEYTESLSHETVRRILKKTKLNLGKRRAG